MGWDKTVQTWVGYSVMGQINSDVLRRSNALLNYGENVNYYENMLHRGGIFEAF